MRQVQDALTRHEQSVTLPDELAAKSVTLQGFPALEYLLYGDGADILEGGAGNDVYEVDDLDQIIEQDGGGFDTVKLTTNYTGNTYSLANTQYVEAIDASQLNRSMTLYGTDGNDYIIGTAAIDTLVGGMGDDTYVITDNDVITEPSQGGADTVILSSENFSSNH